MISKKSSLFPRTVCDFDDIENIVNEGIMLDAHKLIREDHLSPYEAWMMSVYGDTKDAASILGLTEDQCQKLFDFPNSSAPPLSVLRFCIALGVHPAHLLPSSGNLKYETHSPIFKAMLELLREKPKREVAHLLEGYEIKSDDLEECRQAFCSERRKMTPLVLGKSPYINAVVARLRILAFNSKAEPALSSNSSRINRIFGIHTEPTQPDLSRKSKKINRIFGMHASDIGEVVEMHQSLLEHKEHRLLAEAIKAEENLKRTTRELIDLGDVLFGSVNSSEVVHRILYFLSISEEYSRLSEESKLIELRGLVGEYLHPDFLKHAIVELKEPQQIVERFVEQVEIYLSQKEEAKLSVNDFIALEKSLDSFIQWKLSDKGQEEINMLCNYMLMKPYLPDDQENLPQFAPLNNRLADHSVSPK